MTSVGEFFTSLIGVRHVKKQVVEIERELAEHKATIRQNSQVLESGSRVMANMTGMMRMMAEADANE